MMHFHVPVTAMYIFMSKCLIEATFMALKFYLSSQIENVQKQLDIMFVLFFYIIIFFLHVKISPSTAWYLLEIANVCCRQSEMTATFQ